MSPKLVFGDAETVREHYRPLKDWQIDEDAGEWIQCPFCGSENAYMIFWEKTDFDFKCVDCPSGTGVR